MGSELVFIPDGGDQGRVGIKLALQNTCSSFQIRVIVDIPPSNAWDLRLDVKSVDARVEF